LCASLYLRIIYFFLFHYVSYSIIEYKSDSPLMLRAVCKITICLSSSKIVNQIIVNFVPLFKLNFFFQRSPSDLLSVATRRFYLIIEHVFKAITLLICIREAFKLDSLIFFNSLLKPTSTKATYDLASENYLHPKR
jgi:hypothetical protein